MKTLFLFLTLCCSCPAQDIQLSQKGESIKRHMSALFAAYHSHLEGWETRSVKATGISKQANKQIKALLATLKKAKPLSPSDKALLSPQFEKSLTLLNRRLSSLEQQLDKKQLSDYAIQADAIEALLATHMPILLKHVISQPTLVKE